MKCNKINKLVIYIKMTWYEFGKYWLRLEKKQIRKREKLLRKKSVTEMRQNVQNSRF